MFCTPVCIIICSGKRLWPGMHIRIPYMDTAQYCCHCTSSFQGFLHDRFNDIFSMTKYIPYILLPVLESITCSTLEQIFVYKDCHFLHTILWLSYTSYSKLGNFFVYMPLIGITSNWLYITHQWNIFLSKTSPWCCFDSTCWCTKEKKKIGKKALFFFK